MVFKPSAGGINFLFQPSDCVFSDGLNSDLKQLGTLATYVPVVTSQTGTITSYTATGVYLQYGQVCFVNVGITLTNVGSASGTLFFTLPFQAFSVAHSGACREIINTGFLFSFTIASSGTTASVARYDNSGASTWINNNVFPINFSYMITI